MSDNFWVERLGHDASWATARAFLDMIGHNYREEEQRELFAAFYTGCKEMLAMYCLYVERQRRRITPSNN